MKKIIIFLFVALAITALVFSYDRFQKISAERARIIAERAVAWERLKHNINRQTRGYKGTAAIVIQDIKTGWRIESCEYKVMPSASLVKIPVMMAYFSAEKEGRLSFDDIIILRRADKTDGSGKLKDMVAGSKHRIRDLIYLMITESDNTAANILINRLGLEELNGYFAKLGLKNTNLSRRMMDFKSRRAGIENYTTASDMAYLLEKLYRGKFIDKDISNKCLALLAEQKVNDRIPKKLPPATTVAHKTGLENGICHDVGIVYTPKGDFIICVLTKHKYTTARPTKRLISQLSLLTYNYYSGL
jgi:beta-lactamase class A